MEEPYVSIIVLTYNAKEYLNKCFHSLKLTNYNNYEIIVVDNDSENEVREMLTDYRNHNLIDKIYFSDTNSMFSAGNNQGARVSSDASKYLLFVNSDIEIINPNWLNLLFQNKPNKGIISFGAVGDPPWKPDGWCFLIDKETFEKIRGLDENYKFWGSITKLTYDVLKLGYSVKSIVNPKKYVIHYGQKSWGDIDVSQFPSDVKKYDEFLKNSDIKLIEL